MVRNGHPYIFEFKVTSGGTVDEKREIVKVGVVFDTAARNVKEWKVAE
ncbi:hypothetical protein [Candidatus Symbiothrix dinenymphae]|nr:hypothetical protein [Candidatus Symbiothrix dinenymphae]